MAAWDSPSWQSWTPPTRRPWRSASATSGGRGARSCGCRWSCGCPAAPPLWIDSSEGRRTEATALARGLVVRMLAAFPPGQLEGARGRPGRRRARRRRRCSRSAAAWCSPRRPRRRVVRDAGPARRAGRPDADGRAGRRAGHARRHLRQGPPAARAARLPVRLRRPGRRASCGSSSRRARRPGCTSCSWPTRRDASTLGPLVSTLWRSMLRLSAVPDDHIGDPGSASLDLHPRRRHRRAAWTPSWQGWPPAPRSPFLSADLGGLGLVFEP
jgi:hypothetical protein